MLSGNRRPRSSGRVKSLLSLLFGVTILILLLLVCACGTAEQSAGYRFTDAKGRTVTLSERPTRVVSLMGSYAEVWLNAGGTLVGVTADVEEENRFEVDESVAIVGSVKKPNLEMVISLNPDFVIMSPDIAGQVEAAATLENAQIPYAFFKTERFKDYLGMLRICCDLTGRDDLYKKNGLDVQQSIRAILESTDLQTHPKVLFLRVYSTGAKAKATDNMVTYMLEDFGCVNIAKQYPSLLEELSDEVIVREDPDFILATAMGDETQAQITFDALKSRPAWKDLSAIRNGANFMLPKNLFHYKPNARWGESYAYLKKILFK